MKTYARYAYLITLALAPACGDDGDAASDDTGADASTTGPSGGSTTDVPSTGTPSSSGSTSSSAEGSTGPDDESSTGSDPFAGCRRDLLEDDYVVIDELGVPGPTRWYGPGADGDGNLIDDGQTEFVVSVTYLALRPDTDSQLLGQLNAANSMALYSNPGMVALQLGASMTCGSLRTFTVWESNAALMEFVGSEAHLQSIGAFPSVSRGGSTLSVWAEPAAVPEITLENAMTRMTKEDPYD
ncbi:MAG: hypothetical protein ACRBN8_23840 [Nannocystales bacterium]